MQLSRAGFSYHPAPGSPDNVVCFLCSVKLDGWEPTDNPLSEHLVHSSSCAWALSLSVSRNSASDPEARDPLSAEMLEARRGTFEAIGEGWPHESKRGWRCKVAKMIEAGWAFDPSPDTEDGVTCFYCDLSLDGWEPKDDPLVEHRRRGPDCAFFALCERFHGKGLKGKGKARMSAVSVAEEDELVADEDAEAGVNDSIVTTASTAMVKSAGGKKKGGRAPKAAKGRKHANTTDSTAQVEEVVEYREPSPEVAITVESSAFLPVPEDLPIQPAAVEPKRKKGSRASKQVLDSSVMEVSQLQTSTGPAKKATRGRKPKVQRSPTPELEVEEEAHEGESQHRMSEASAQLQDELERSFQHPEEEGIEVEEPEYESTPQQGRGTKRTSEGVRKISGMEAFPVPPKAKGGRKAKKESAAVVVHEEAVIETAEEEQDPASAPPQQKKPKPTARAKKPASTLAGSPDPQLPAEEDQPASPPAAKKASQAKKAAPKPKSRKASSTRSSKATTVTVFEPALPDEIEDLDRDEREISAELARMAASPHLSQAIVQSEHDRVNEYELSPSHSHAHHPHAGTHAAQIQALEHELELEMRGVEGEGMANLVATITQKHLPAVTSSPQHRRVLDAESGTASPGTSGSDKENAPSSAAVKSSSHHKAAAVSALMMSPTKTSRVPLAPGTPNRSPSKLLRAITSDKPWAPSDLEVLLASPVPNSPRTFAQRLVEGGGGGVLTKEERGMSVEAWVRWRAEVAEGVLRGKCERLVGVFEREGGRAREVLEGVGVV